MTIERDITNAKNRLIAKAIKKGGVWENFGEKEDLKLRNKYPVGYMGEERKNMDKLQEFFQWHLNFDDRQLEVEKSKLKKVI